MASIVTSKSFPLEYDTEAARLFEVHSEWLGRYCRRQLGSTADAEDAVQTTFLNALRALRRNVVPDREEAWLTAIAKNVCHAQRRTLGRRGPLASDVDLDTIAAQAPTDGDRELLIGLPEALASLPENQRRALVLREWHGVPSHEIASRLQLSTPATHALISRARRSLARALTVPRPLAGFDLSWLLYKLEVPLRLLGGGLSKAAAVAVAAGVVAGGVALERESSPLSHVDRSRVLDVSATLESPGGSQSSSARASEPIRVGASARRPVTSPVASDPATGVGGSASPKLAPVPRPNDDSSPASPRSAPAPGDETPIPPPLGEPLPVLESPPVPEPPLPILEPLDLLPQLPVPVPDPSVELPPHPAPPPPASPLP